MFHNKRRRQESFKQCLLHTGVAKQHREFGTSHRGGMRSEHEGQHVDVTRSDRQLMVKTTRANNRLYKVTLHVYAVQCLQINSSTNSSMWHACLGHINRDTIRLMVNKDFVIGVPDIDHRCVPHAYKEKRPGSPFHKQHHTEHLNLSSLFMLTFVVL